MANSSSFAAYYEDEWTTLYHGDCREVLPTLERESADLLLTDPPYEQGYQSNHRTSEHRAIVGDDGSLDIPASLALCTTALRPFRHVYVFGPADLSETPFTATTQLIWDKGLLGMGDLSQPWGLSHEPITFAVYVPSKAGRARGDGRLSARLRQGSVLRVQRMNVKQNDRHPTEKPVSLLRQLIESSSCFGETVLDPFAGSGSTLEAARLEGRKSIGIEIDEGYCEVIAARLSGSSIREVAMF